MQISRSSKGCENLVAFSLWLSWHTVRDGIKKSHHWCKCFIISIQHLLQNTHTTAEQ